MFPFVSISATSREENVKKKTKQQRQMSNLTKVLFDTDRSLTNINIKLTGVKLNENN